MYDHLEEVRKAGRIHPNAVHPYYFKEIEIEEHHVYDIVQFKHFTACIHNCSSNMWNVRLWKVHTETLVAAVTAAT